MPRREGFSSAHQQARTDDEATVSGVKARMERAAASFAALAPARGLEWAASNPVPGGVVLMRDGLVHCSSVSRHSRAGLAIAAMFWTHSLHLYAKTRPTAGWQMPLDRGAHIDHSGCRFALAVGVCLRSSTGSGQRARSSESVRRAASSEREH